MSERGKDSWREADVETERERERLNQSRELLLFTGASLGVFEVLIGETERFAQLLPTSSELRQPGSWLCGGEEERLSSLLLST